MAKLREYLGLIQETIPLFQEICLGLLTWLCKARNMALILHFTPPISPTTNIPYARAPPRHSHGDPTSLVPHERLTDLAVVPREKPHTGAAAWNNPEIPPSSRDEGLCLLHGLATNLATSLQTPQEA